MLCSEEEKLLEIRTLVTETKGVQTRIVSDHIVNLLQGIRGNLDTEKEHMLAVIDGYLALPEEERKLFQIARRLGHVVSLKELSRVSGAHLEEYRKITGGILDQAGWDRKMNDLIGGYI